MIEFKTGDILSEDAEALVNTVNCVGFMGRGIALQFKKAWPENFKAYAAAVVDNARTLGARLQEHGFDLVSGGTDTHLILVDLRPKGLTGKAADEALERAGITCNKNGVPGDPEKPFITSGIRLGSPAATTRGFGRDEFVQVADWITEVLDGLKAHGAEDNGAIEQAVRDRVRDLCARFPIYPDLVV